MARPSLERRPSLPLTALACVASVCVVAPSAHAHFVLQQPAAYSKQNLLGDPQKAPPCGDDGSLVETGAVTAYRPGDTVTIKINEKIYHPGHYRVALAVNDPSELPPEPVVTPGSTACGSAPIDPAPTFPVLADGVLVHTTRLNGPQTFEVTLPDDVTCDRCTLQVIQFMSNHALNDPGGCYYHHCATLAITPDGSGGVPGAGDTGAAGDTAAASSDPPADHGEHGPGEDAPASGEDAAPGEASSACGCSAATGAPASLWAALLVVIGRRRRAATVERPGSTDRLR